MRIARLGWVLVLGTLSAAPICAQTPRAAVVRLRALPVTPVFVARRDSVVADTAMQRHHSHAPLIGAIAGAIALPTSLYAAFHDQDSGPWRGGAILLFGAIGAWLGLMIGLAIANHHE